MCVNDRLTYQLTAIVHKYVFVIYCTKYAKGVYDVIMSQKII